MVGMFSLACAPLFAPEQPAVHLCAAGQSTDAWFAQQFPNGDAATIQKWFDAQLPLPHPVVVCPDSTTRVDGKLRWVEVAHLHGEGIDREYLLQLGADPNRSYGGSSLRVVYEIGTEPRRRAEIELGYKPKK